jgi:amidase
MASARGRTHGAFVVGPSVLAAGPDSGTLAGRTVVVKDVFDVAGVPTGAGNPDWAATHPVPAAHAVAVQRLIGAGAAVIGKTVTDELAFSLSGTNVHHGTPPNPAAPGRVPGGSSSGSASAVADGLADIGLGTDTAGSIRVPASYCGLVGVRPTWGRVPATGVVPLAPGYDTVGWLTRSAGLAAAVGPVLLDPWPLATPAPFRRLVIATDAFRLLDDGLLDALRPAVRILAEVVGAWHEEPLAPAPEFEGGLRAWAQAFRVEQGRQVWRTHGPWIERHEPDFGPGVAARFAWAASIGPDDVVVTKAVRRSALRRLESVLDGAVVCLPAACGEAPDPDSDRDAKESVRARTVALTAPACLGGAPSISLPAGRGPHGPVNLAVIGAPGSDEALLELAVRYAAAGRTR